MNVLWILAHPEPLSRKGALRDAGLASLTNLGHDYDQSDLYAMRWRSTVTSDDFTDHRFDDSLVVTRASQLSYRRDTLSEDIRREQAKLAWADAVVFQFPLWWYSMPAIKKGWFDRVFVKGFA